MWSSELPILLGEWPHHMASGILVPQPGIKPAPSALEARGFNHRVAGAYEGIYFGKQFW